MFDALINAIIGLTAAGIALTLVIPCGVYLLVSFMAKRRAGTDIQYEDGE